MLDIQKNTFFFHPNFYAKVYELYVHLGLLLVSLQLPESIHQ